ncbi:MAG: type II secretion system protein J [Halanaerobiales bacterium]
MSEDGFTLIEILIAITITGVILTAVFMFLDQGLLTWERVADQSEWEQNWRVFDKQLRNDLSNLYYSPIYKDNLFKGNYQGIRFLTKKDGVLKEVSYKVDYYSNLLVRKEEGHQSYNRQSIAGGYNYLSNNYQVQDMNFFSDFSIYRIDYQYFDSRNNYWVNNWSLEEKDYLPNMVKVTISSEGFELPPILADIHIGRSHQRGVSIYE